MIVDRITFGEPEAGEIWCRIWLDEPVPDDFAERLLVELLAFGEPVGLGVVEAFARRKENLSDIITEAVHKAAHTPHGRRNLYDAFYFDYVAGNRIKVYYLPHGRPIEEDDEEEEAYKSDIDPVMRENAHRPMIDSVEFEDMYGFGSLEGAVKMALAR